MKKLILLATVLTMSSCSWTKIASLTAVSTRNLEGVGKYQELKRYVEADDKVDRKYLNVKADGMDKLNICIENAIAYVPGGEYMRNVSIFTKKGKIKIVGDVWGTPGAPMTDQQKKDAEKGK